VPLWWRQVMQYSVAFQSFLSYLEEDREGGCCVLEGPEGQRVSDRLVVWARRLLRMGLDGAVLVDVLQDVGLPQIQVIGGCPLPVLAPGTD
jgi:hypothetical protein